MTLSKAQIDKFAAIYPNNARPVQPLNGRAVLESK
jgi:carbonic anhydrase